MGKPQRRLPKVFKSIKVSPLRQTPLIPTFMQKIPLRQRLRYHFDNSLSRGTASLIGWLALITLVMVLLATSALVLARWQPAAGEPDAPALASEGVSVVAAPTEALAPADAHGFSFREGFWQSLMRSMDAGMIGGDAAEEDGRGWAYRLWGLCVTFGGIFILSSLIGVLTSGLESKLEELRKGRSFVCEENHTLILGWSSRVFLVISELAIANESAAKPRIVILAQKDKVEMEDEIREKVGSTGRTKVICRSGSPIDLTELEIVNPHATKSIIILSPEGYTDPDAQVIKMILAITNNPNRRPEPYHIVAELRKSENVELAKMIGKEEVEIILPDDLIARITVQTSRQTGLSVVYKELLDFGGDEIYFKSEPGLAGKTYGEALTLFEGSSLIGIYSKGVTKLNPAMETTIGGGDQIVVISADDDKIRMGGKSSVSESYIISGKASEPVRERNLILGWNARAEIILREMDHYVAPGSELTVLAELAEARDSVEAIAGEAKNLKITFVMGDTSNRALLDSMELTTFEHIIVLCYADHMEIQEADSKTLMTLLHLRDIESKKGEAYSIVSEMLDVKNRALAEIAKADDFIVSDELAGLLLTQVSENKALGAVFEDLFDSGGAEIYLKPAGDYVSLGNAVSYYTILESARRRNETAIGYRLMKDADQADKFFGVRVNPLKSEKVTLSDDDMIVVLADS